MGAEAYCSLCDAHDRCSFTGRLRVRGAAKDLGDALVPANGTPCRDDCDVDSMVPAVFAARFKQLLV